MNDIQFYVKCEHFLVRMDNYVGYFSYINNWKYFYDIII